MTVDNLIREYRKRYPHYHFFDKDTLAFFGERISEMRVLKKTVKIIDFFGNVHECYCLSSLQRNYPGKPMRVYHYFDVNTFENIDGVGR